MAGNVRGFMKKKPTGLRFAFRAHSNLASGSEIVSCQADSWLVGGRPSVGVSGSKIDVDKARHCWKTFQSIFCEVISWKLKLN